MLFSYPDVITRGLRHRVDQLRGVLERTRGDLTNNAQMVRLLKALGAVGLGDALALMNRSCHPASDTDRGPARVMIDRLSAVSECLDRTPPSGKMLPLACKVCTPMGGIGFFLYCRRAGCPGASW